MENRIHLSIEEADMSAIQDAISVLNSKLAPLLVTISADERKKLPKMGETSVPFVQKVVEYAESDPQFNPPYLAVDELKVDFDAVRQLNSIIRPLRQLLNGLDDTNLLAGSEAYVAALSYYNSVKLAARMKMPEASAIHSDLKKRFAA